MSEALSPYLWLVPGLPLIASVMTAFFGPRFLRERSHWPCVLSIAFAFFAAAAMFLAVRSSDEAGVVYWQYTWFKAGSVDVRFSLRADALSAMMAVMVTFISSFIAIYSAGYMHGDKGYARFFAAMSLFVASMTTLVLADNFILLFAGWEGVGLCSYLLIGFWFEKPSAADAARKAFLVTRIGDVGLLLGILLLWFNFGSLNYDDVFARVKALDMTQPLNQSMLYAAALLLFCGAAGKSAQFPLHVWLPDAMEGPTPVSALIHAATMVTAGVYLVARCTPIYQAVPDAQLIVAGIGGFTSLLAALIALTQTDLKRVLAYSTLSQLGYMFLALGCGLSDPSAPGLVTFAVTAAMFHLFTHAFFKALLFLGAGSVMHAMGHVIDMRRFSGLRKVMPTTHWTFLVGSLALAGIPPLSGFWSKDEILDACLRASESSRTSASVYYLLLVSGVVTAGLTAFYTGRAYFKTFWGELVVPPEADAHADHASHGGHGGHGSHGSHGHRDSYESPPVMTVPLVVLAVFAAGVGFLLGPLGPSGLGFGHFMEKMAETSYWPHGEHENPNWGLMGVSTLVAAAGGLLSWFLYVKQPELPGKLAQSFQGLYQLSYNKFFIDEIYSYLIVRPAEWLAAACGRLDLGVIDSFVDLVGHGPRLLGEVFRPIQNGLVQFYALAMVLGLTVFLLSLIYKL